jgi:fatty acid desaturase
MSSATTAIDDFSANFSTHRTKLVSPDGVRYINFVRSLVPNYRKVWFHIGIGYFSLGIAVLCAIFFGNRNWNYFYYVPFLSFLIGYCIAYLQLFIHEGAHYNLAPNKNASDLVADLLIAWMIGTSVKKYRVVHFEHHKSIGTPNDTEHTYFFPLNLLFIVKALFAIRAIEVLLARLNFLGVSAPERSSRSQLSARDGAVLVAGIAAHGLICVGLYTLGGLGAMMCWILGIGVFFPFFGALRQLLEHRSDAEAPSVDFFTRDHGAMTRIFQDGPIGSTLGGAGFNRHLLHHWEPQVSYTNLPELEEFLKKTDMAHIIEARRTTYAKTFMRLFAVGITPKHKA